MASKASIAIGKHNQLERIHSALTRLLEAEDIYAEPVAIPRTSRYPDALYQQQLTVIADALEVLSPAPEPEPEAMTLPAEDMPDVHLTVFDDDVDDVEITDFDISPDGVIVAETSDGETIVSDGQEAPDEPPVKGRGKK